jgi:hypothetical protein
MLQGAYWRSSPILPHGFRELRPRIAYGGRVLVSAVLIKGSLYDPTNAALRARMASAILDGFGMASMEYGVDS